MRMVRGHWERHRGDRVGWLRAAVLGANDGIVSTASLLLGVAAASPDRSAWLVAGVAGLVAGSMSMAAGEYVSVHTQADTERADLERERGELESDPESELRELAAIYAKRGLEPGLAWQVAEQLMDHDALGAHARDELGHAEGNRARPLQAALSSAASFAVGALAPLGIAMASPANAVIGWVGAGSLVLLAVLGALAARVGGAPMGQGAWRITFWGALAMAATTAIGHAFGVVA
jgi:VIT1/CCC1 family predicted Fe2+/Mn2+ transporter